MTHKESIKFYEEELEKLEKHKESLLEIDKNIAYADKKINHIYDLLTILRNCEESEILREENQAYKEIFWTIEEYLKNIERAKWKNNSDEEKLVITNFLEYLENAIKEEE